MRFDVGINPLKLEFPVSIHMHIYFMIVPTFSIIVVNKSNTKQETQYEKSILPYIALTKGFSDVFCSMFAETNYK